MDKYPNLIAPREDAELIEKIVRRALEVVNSSGHLYLAMVKSGLSKQDLMMDMTACHMNGCPLKLKELYEADDANLAHDVFGITRHLNRETGKLEDCFLPRFSAPEPMDLERAVQRRQESRGPGMGGN